MYCQDKFDEFMGESRSLTRSISHSNDAEDSEEPVSAGEEPFTQLPQVPPMSTSASCQRVLPPPPPLLGRPFALSGPAFSYLRTSFVPPPPPPFYSPVSPLPLFPLGGGPRGAPPPLAGGYSSLCSRPSTDMLALKSQSPMSLEEERLAEMSASLDVRSLSKPQARGKIPDEQTVMSGLFGSSRNSSAESIEGMSYTAETAPVPDNVFRNFAPLCLVEPCSASVPAAHPTMSQYFSLGKSAHGFGGFGSALKSSLSGFISSPVGESDTPQPQVQPLKKVCSFEIPEGKIHRSFMGSSQRLLKKSV